jgi:hypothetical protein
MLGVRPAVDRDRPARRPVEAEDHAHRRRFAGAVGTEETGDRPRPYGEGQVIDGESVAVAFGEVLGFDHDVHDAVPERSA